MIVGHSKIIELLERIIGKNNISHAYLFSGPESVGKFTLAKIFARNIISGTKLPLLPSGKSADVGNDNLIPDLVILEPEVEEKRGITKERDIKIEKVREIQKNLSLFPYKGKYKVLIVNNAHKMTEESQNALLKTLEEPNATSIIILVAHEEGKILPTVKSRCQKIKFNLVSDDEIKKNLSSAAPATLEQLISLSLGRPGLAVRMIKDKEEFNLRRDALEKLKSLPKAGINQRLKIAEELSKNISETVKKMELWIWALHAPALKDTRLFKIIGKMDESLNEIKNTNANAKLVLENLLLNL